MFAVFLFMYERSVTFVRHRECFTREAALQHALKLSDEYAESVEFDFDSISVWLDGDHYFTLGF